MSTTYAQRQTTAQKKDAPTAASVLDSSSQSESLQRKADMANNAAQRAEAPRPNNTGMPDNLKAGIESLSGFSMDDVRVHYNSSKPATVQALAYTQGTDIHVAPGQEKHLPHEAWHVAQQMAGRVSPTTNINGMPVNDNAGLEHEADVMGEKAVQCKTAGLHFTNGKEQSSTVQRMAYAKTNEDGTIAAETEQYEGNVRLAGLFGRTKGDKRPEIVAKKVDQYKKEILTYIAQCIAEKGMERNVDYGSHISVIITGGVWYIALNSDCNVDKDTLQNDANAVKEDIKNKWTAIEQNLNETNFKGDVENDIELAKKQAIYITYRWAGKKNDVVITSNYVKSKDVKHGEMATIESLSSKKEIIRGLCNGKTVDFMTEDQAAEIVFLAYEMESCWRDDYRRDEFNSLCMEFEKKAIELMGGMKGKSIIEFASYLTDIKLMTKEQANKINDQARTISLCLDDSQREKLRGELAEIANEVDDALVNSFVLSKSNKGIIRVGGTKTPCFDCAYEMDVHNDEISEDDSSVHKRHQAENIGGRRAVTMTPEYGDAFANWRFHEKARPKTCKADGLLSHNSNQDQDYNELYDTFNSLNLTNEKMTITNTMLRVWRQRCIDMVKSNEKVSLEKSCISELFSLKDSLMHHLNEIYKKNNVDKFNGKLAYLNEWIDAYNENKNNEKSKKLIEEERNLITTIDVQIQKKNFNESEINGACDGSINEYIEKQRRNYLSSKKCFELIVNKLKSKINEYTSKKKEFVCLSNLCRQFLSKKPDMVRIGKSFEEIKPYIENDGLRLYSEIGIDKEQLKVIAVTYSQEQFDFQNYNVFFTSLQQELIKWSKKQTNLDSTNKALSFVNDLIQSVVKFPTIPDSFWIKQFNLFIKNCTDKLKEPCYNLLNKTELKQYSLTSDCDDRRLTCFALFASSKVSDKKDDKSESKTESEAKGFADEAINVMQTMGLSQELIDEFKTSSGSVN